MMGSLCLEQRSHHKCMFTHYKTVRLTVLFEPLRLTYTEMSYDFWIFSTRSGRSPRRGAMYLENLGLKPRCEATILQASARV